MPLFDEPRKSPRVPKQISVEWEIVSQGLRGSGELLDLSATGARLRIETLFARTRGVIFTLESPAIPLLPRTARLRWFRWSHGLNGPNPVVLCGLVFNEQGLDAKPWADWVARQIEGSSISSNEVASSRSAL